jgi:glutaredoxin-like protein
MSIVTDQLREQLKGRFAERLRGPVQLVLYTRPGSSRLILPSGLGCPTCEDARRMAEDLAAAAPERISLQVVDVSGGGGDGVQVPTLMVGVPGEEARIRWQGLPAGFEFATVVEAIERVSTGAHDLSPASLQGLAEVREPIEIMVFTTPGCRYCPQAVSLANRMALASPQVRSITVAAEEFPDLARAFGVQGVPQTVVNRRGVLVGARPEAQFVSTVLQLAGVTTTGPSEPKGESSE